MSARTFVAKGVTERLMQERLSEGVRKRFVRECLSEI